MDKQYLYSGILGYCAVQPLKFIPTFRMNMFTPSSELEVKVLKSWRCKPYVLTKNGIQTQHYMVQQPRKPKHQIYIT